VNAPQQTEIFLGRQPILDVRRRVVGYELLFRSGRNLTAGVTDDVLATSTVITQTMGMFGIEAALGKHTGFINVSYELLMSDVLELLPRRRIVLELLETMKIDSSVIERCRELKAQGFRLALDDFQYDPSYEPLFPLIDIIKIDIMLSTTQAIDEVQKCVQHYPIRLLAEKVEDVEQFKRCKDRGFHLFQGYFFARPTVLSAKKTSPNQAALLRVLSQVMSDIDIAEIERTFKESPDLVLGLLRLVNSAALGTRVKIGSIQQALVLLGRRQLQRWVQLLLYARDGGSPSSPLMQLAATRARTMELLNQWHSEHSGQAESAFIVGIMSLADVALGLKIDDVVAQIDVVDEVKEAILKQEGFFGHMLTLVKKTEAGEFDAASDLLFELGITPDEFNNAQLQAMQWASSLNETAATI
jgi:EAL and modified HD-GYP domain-containing signal transduction protein